jgi:hypothetical protein
VWFTGHIASQKNNTKNTTATGSGSRNLICLSKLDMDGITLSYTNILVKETIQKTRQANIVLFPSQSLIAALYPFLLTETHKKKRPHDTKYNVY